MKTATKYGIIIKNFKGKGGVLVTLSEYKKNKEYLVCVDSDGCAMDTMDIKHITCFGPCMVEEWGLEQWENEILNRWNEINLYSMTRGINRFKGLALALSEINEKYVKIDGVDGLIEWANNAKELSNGALTIKVNESDNVCLKKALNWSASVNERIKLIPEENKLPFALVKDALTYAHKFADVAIVSSANLDAVLEEWEKHRLLEHVDIVLSQNVGSKAFCITELLKKGYDKANVVMCGDAPGDLQSAKTNGVYFYPILVKDEKASWQEFINLGLNNLLNNVYGGEYQAKKENQFIDNLTKK